MLEVMRQNLEIISANRKELCEEVEPQTDAPAAQEGETVAVDDFAFDENTFLDNIDNEEE